MKARQYIEQQYLPWILFLDPQDTIKHFTNGKEEYLCELYNHISKEFKALERYELFMFRVETFKQMTPLGMMHFIAAKTPDVYYQSDSAFLIIAYNEENLLYYTVDYVLDSTFSLKKYHDKKTTIIDNTDGNFKDIMNKINADLLSF